MKVHGKWLTQTTDAKQLEWFVDLYEMTPEQIIKDYKLEVRSVPENIKLIVFPEYDGSINQIFEIEDGDMIFVWGGGCCGTIFNTDGIAFMDLVRDDKVIAQWVMDNSPYEMNDDDLEECEFDMSKLPEGISREQVIFVAQL